MFAKISEIEIGIPATWQEKKFLTFDVDWAVDDVLLDTIKLVESADVPATWFVTHSTPLLERLRQNKKFELAIHPNFNIFFNPSSKSEKTVDDVLDDILKVVPDAVSIRSHSMTQSSRLLDIFSSKSLKYECNHFIPAQANIELRPWLTWNNLVKVPHFWEDDLACIYNNVSDIKPLLKKPGLKVFDFHPIHVFLNTEKISRYESTREFHSDIRHLIKFRNSEGGSRSSLIDLLSSE